MTNFALAIYTLITVLSVFYLVPPAEGLGNFVRLAFFHIPTAWVSVLAFLWSAFYALRHLKTEKQSYDIISARAAAIGFIFCLLGTISGTVFAKLTWGVYWNWDPRQVTIFVLLLIYGAYFVLRYSIKEISIRAHVSAVYSLLACIVMPFLVFVIPRFYFSLHPEPLINQNGTFYMDRIMLIVLILALSDATFIFLHCLYRKKGRQL